jgi:hypothetical protein
MNSLFWVAFGVQWLVLCVLVVLVILLYRQFGLMIMPGSRRVGYGGLDVGARAPALPLRLDGSREVVWDWAAPKSANGSITPQATLALFALAGCQSCDELAADRAGMTQLAQRYPSVRFLWVEGLGKAQPHPVSDGWTLALSPGAGAHSAMEVPGTPFGYLVSSGARVLAKGLVNDPQDIESILSRSSIGEGGMVRVETIQQA